MPGTIATLAREGQPHSATDRQQIGTTCGSAGTGPLPASPVLAWLQAVYSNPRAQVITRKPGEGWKSAPHAWTLDCIAKSVYGLSQVVGLRPEGRVRLITVDIDRKPNRVSRYWHPYGQSRQLLALEREALAAGCSFTIVRSSASGGLHCLIQLPVGLRAWEAYWLGLELITRAGMEEASGQCELFPSRINYSASTDPSTWAQSHGVRLPGQEGSALLIGDRTETDTAAIYSHLLQALAYTEALPGWDALLEAAAARRQAARRPHHQPAPHHRPRRATKRAHGVRWTGSGQSNRNLRLLTTWARAAYPKLRTVQELASITRTAAVEAPGFWEHASEESKQAVTRGDWPERWAGSSLKRDRVHGAPRPIGGDKHHNARLLKLSRWKLTRAWREAGAAAQEWGRRKVAEKAGLSRRIVDKHWAFWRQLMGAGGGGPHPPLTVWGVPSAVPSSENQSLPSVPPVASVEPVTVAVPVGSQQEGGGDGSDSMDRPGRAGPLSAVLDRFRTRRDESRSAGDGSAGVLPFRPEAVPLDRWRERQRAELMAWIGVA